MLSFANRQNLSKKLTGGIYTAFIKNFRESITQVVVLSAG